VQQLPKYIVALQSLTTQLLAQGSRAQSASACDYLDLVSFILYGYMWYKNLAALQSGKHTEQFIAAKQQTAAYYFSRILPKIEGLFALLRHDSSVIDTLDADHF